MPLNTINYASVLQNRLDQRMVETSTSGWMEANAGQVIYNGGKSIKVPRMELTGLMDYDRDFGYPQGSVTLTYQTLDMTMDRGTSFLLDAMDVNETNFVASASALAGQFQKDKVVPEIDAYRYSKLAAIAQENQTEYKVDPLTVYEALCDDIAFVRDKVGETEPLVCSINGLVKAQLEKLKEFKNSIDLADFKQGSINTKIKTLNEVSILGVPSSRMKTSYVFADGKTDGQTEGGFTPGADAKSINWIVMPKKAAIAVSKQDKMKIFSPDVYQKADAWFVGYRRYHDLWVLKSMLECIKPNISAV